MAEKTVRGKNYSFIFQREVKQMYQDITLKCKDCGNDFVFTAGEQEFYAEKGFQNQPQRCRACRDARKNSAKPQREMFETVCAKCGKVARVHFQPSSDRAVYCSECFAAMRSAD
jgi:CxxC-x17-CxxC domain-containing protein